MKPNELLAVLKDTVPAHHIPVIDYVWNNRNLYVKWPRQALLFGPEMLRDKKFHVFSEGQKQSLKVAGIRPDTRSNGPAIMSFLLAGGERPWRANSNKQWSIHHIYDGNFPAPGMHMTTRAVIDSRYFTEAAGLVAIHPIADALACEFAYFAWLLRCEAFVRFKFDPDDVFDVQQEDAEQLIQPDSQ